MVFITIVTGAYKPSNITGGPHIVQKQYIFFVGLCGEARPRPADGGASALLRGLRLVVLRVANVFND